LRFDTTAQLQGDISSSACAPMDTPSSKSQYWPEIDGLRALAVMAVVVNHLNKNILPSGYLGVDIFFVISGFVVTSSLLAKPDLNPKIFFLGFWSKRIKRIQPALITCVFLTGLMICLFNPSPEQEIKTGITALFGFSNIYLTKQSTDYFATSAELNPFTQTWFLGALIQSEFILCLIIWLSLLLSASFGHQRNHKRLFAWIISIVITISLLRFIYLYPIDRSFTYFSASTRFWEIGLGSLLYLFIGYINERGGLKECSPPLMHRLINSRELFLALLLIIFSLFFAPLNLAVQVVVLTTVLTALVLFFLTQSKNSGVSLLAKKEIVFWGSISYSIYLWHWSVLSISRWTTGIYWWLIPVQMGVILFLAWSSSHYIETPLRKLTWSKSPWKTIAYGIAASVVAASLLFSLVKVPVLSLYSGRYPELVATGVKSLTDPYFIDGTEGKWEGIDCIISGDVDIDKKIDIERCTLGSFVDSRTRVLVAGNSFSASFTHAFDELVRNDKYSITITSSWGSSVLPRRLSSQNDDANSLKSYSDYYWSVIVADITANLSPGDWVFLVNDMAGFSPLKRTSENDIYFQEFRDDLVSFSESLSSRELNLAVLHGNPFAREANCKPNAAMRQWFHPFGSPCKMPGRTASLQRRKALDEFLHSLEKEGKITIVDLFDIFCPGRICSYNAVNGDLLYRDEYSHPSVEAARLSAPVIHQALTSQP
jgi:peptidoglycan/LPS O-acetylase OafA/YrhL